MGGKGTRADSGEGIGLCALCALRERHLSRAEGAENAEAGGVGLRRARGARPTISGLPIVHGSVL